MMNPKQVAIIGAGIAGLHAARLLQVRGCSVRIFEKARAASGRVSTRRLDFGGFDHGAQYFTARDPVFETCVRDWTARSVVESWQGRVVSLSRGKATRESSPRTRWVGAPSMSAIARDLARGLEIQSETRIETTRREGDRWTLISDAGIEFAGFDWLVVAVPAPQAVPLLSASVEFSSKAQGVRFLACHALMLALEEPLACEFDAAFVGDSPLAWIARQASKPARDPSNAWLIHSTSEWSEAHLDRPSERAIELLRDAFADAVGGPLPKTRGGAVHRWLFARPVQSLVEDLLWDERLGLGVCGDWLQGDRIEDAYLSAERLARAMLAGDPLPR
jgi:renalase